MFNKTLVQVLCKILGWIMIVVSALCFEAGFFVASAQQINDTAGTIGYWLGWTGGCLFMTTFFYLILATIHKLND